MRYQVVCYEKRHTNNRYDTTRTAVSAPLSAKAMAQHLATCNSGHAVTGVDDIVGTFYDLLSEGYSADALRRAAAAVLAEQLAYTEKAST